MKKLILKVTIALNIATLLILATDGCREDKHVAMHHLQKNYHEKVHVYYHNGNYCYHDNDWVWYYLMFNNSESPYSSSTYQPLTSSQISSGSWKVGTPPESAYQKEVKTEELNGTVDKAEENQEVDVAPEQTEQDIDIPEENSLDSMEGVESPSSSESTSSSDSSGSDSGDASGSGGE